MFDIRPSRIKIGKGKYCSRICFAKAMKGRTAWNKDKKMKSDWPWNKNRSMKDYPQCGFKKGHKFCEGGEKGWFKKGQIPWIKGKKGLNAGEKNYNWKGGTFKQGGYIMILSLNHPFANKRYVFEHRLVCEKILGRFLTSEERVHHINEIRTDNHLDNLYLFPSKATHWNFHRLKNKPLLISNLI